MQLAMNLFEQAVKWDTSNVEALKSMGEWGIESRNFRQAVEAFTRWHNLEPNNEATFQQLANLYFNMGRYQDALNFTAKWEKAHKDKPMHYITQPVTLARTPSQVVAPAPGWGEHTDEVLSEADAAAREPSALGSCQ